MLKKWRKKQIMEDLKHVQEVLKKWDPIGVYEDVIDGVEPPDDEYDFYAPAILKLLRKSCDAKKLADRLSKIQSNYMGLKPCTERDFKIAAELVSWWKSKSKD